MSLTILEVLQNADYNLKGLPFQVDMAKQQLSNALAALENGYGIDEEYEEHMLKVEKL